ncbi:MAG: tyrosine-type recombinase/integrase [Terracidiphilus sp.]|jgi:integrase
MDMANRSVVLYQSVKIKNKWTLQEVVDDLPRFSKGPLFVTWYEGSKKCSEAVGRDSVHALKMLNKKRLELAYKVAGGEIKESDEGGDQPSEPKKQGKQVTVAVDEYLKNCGARQGKSGYGLASRTPETYQYRLGFLVEFRPRATVDEIDDTFVTEFLLFLRKHTKDLGDRTCYNIMQGVSTFLIRQNNNAAKLVLKGMSYPPTEVIPYEDEDLTKFFSACEEEEELLFKFFLHSMQRDMELANREVRDLLFKTNVLHISPKPDRDFRLKGKRSGQATKGRKVPLPAIFMARMKKFCEGKSPNQLIFPNGIGGVEYHFLRRCKNIARRAGLTNWEEFDLHRWRKTGATRHHEAGVSVRKIQAWLGHESLEETLDYLGIVDAADEVSQEQVNNGALTQFV